MEYFSVYGLNILSNINFSEILEFITDDPRKINFSNQCDLKIVMSEDKILEMEEDSWEDYYHFSSKDFFISWDDVGTFRFLNGEKIVVYSKKDVDSYKLKTYILGPVLAALLHQRGFLVLHASAVKINSYAVAFLGFSGMGKSTLAMALNKAGYPLLTDDILAIQFDENGVPIVYPGFPQTKLSPQSIFSIYGNGGNVSMMPSGPEERFHCLTSNFSNKLLPLKRVYALEGSDISRIVPINSQNALMKLVNYSYFSNRFKDKDKTLNLFQCSNVLRDATIHTLKINRSLKELPKVVEMIEEDVSHDS